MGTVKSKNQVKQKVDYKPWQAFRRAIMYLHKKGPQWSWSDISRQAGMNNAGWAERAMQHRSLVSHDNVRWAIDTALRHGWKPDEEDGGQAKEVLRGRSRSKRAEMFVRVYEELKDTFGGSTREINDAAGSALAGSYYGLKAGRQESVSEETLQKALDLVALCRMGKVPWNGNGVQEPEPEPEAEPEAEDDGNGERRSKAQGPMVEPGTPAHDEFVRICQWLIDEHGYTGQQLSSAAGYFGGHSATNVMEGGRFGAYRLRDLRAYVRDRFHPAHVAELNLGGKAPPSVTDVVGEGTTDAERPEAIASTAPMTPAIPATHDDVHGQVLALSVLVDDHVDRIIEGLIRQRESAPRMMRVAYDHEIKRLREAAESMSALIADFDPPNGDD